jgi:DNA-binding MarR family transcriptional regulator
VTQARFDAVVHAPNRLQICAMLASVASGEFSTVRDELGVSDPVLSKHVKVLDEAGYLRISKATVASRQRTWLALTSAGREAFAGHVAALQQLLGVAPTPDSS